MNPRFSFSIMAKAGQSTEAGEMWEVERIAGKKTLAGETLYLLKWLGVPDEESTWEPLEHLAGCMELVHQYELLAQMSNKCARKTAVEEQKLPEKSKTDTVETAPPQQTNENPPVIKRLRRKSKNREGAYPADSVKSIVRGLKNAQGLSFEVAWQEQGSVQLLNSVVSQVDLERREPRMLALFLLKELKI